jgi:YVTN family beta-propeller protein
MPYWRSTPQPLYPADLSWACIRKAFILSGIAVNRSTGSIYVGYFAGPSTNIIVITGNGYSYLPVSAGPIAINETTNKIYVAGSNGIAVIDGATNSVATTIPDPSATVPTAIALNPATNTIYVANHDSNNVTVIDGFTGSLTTIAVGISPSGVAVDSQTNFIYVANAATHRPATLAT